MSKPHVRRPAACSRNPSYTTPTVNHSMNLPPSPPPSPSPSPPLASAAVVDESDTLPWTHDTRPPAITRPTSVSIPSSSSLSSYYSADSQVGARTPTLAASSRPQSPVRSRTAPPLLRRLEPPGRRIAGDRKLTRLIVATLVDETASSLSASSSSYSSSSSSSSISSTSSSSSPQPPSSPRKTTNALLTLSRTSRIWRAAAVSALYRDPLRHIPQDATFAAAERLCEVLVEDGVSWAEDGRSRSSLGSLVKELPTLGYWTTRWRAASQQVQQIGGGRPSSSRTVRGEEGGGGSGGVAYKSRVSTWAVEMIVGCPLLERLSLPSCQAHDKARLGKVLLQRPLLRALIFEPSLDADSDSDDHLPAYSIDDLISWRSIPLTSLSIQTCHFLQRQSTTHNVQFALTELKLYDCNLDEFQILTLLWGSHSSLKRFEMVRCGSLSNSGSHRGSGIRHILGRLGRNLEHLKIQRQTFHHQDPLDSYADLELVCMRCPSLRTLDISGDFLMTDMLFRRLALNSSQLITLRLNLRPSPKAASINWVRAILPPSRDVRSVFTAKGAYLALVDPSDAFPRADALPKLASFEVVSTDWDSEGIDLVNIACELNGIRFIVGTGSAADSNCVPTSGKSNGIVESMRS